MRSFINLSDDENVNYVVAADILTTDVNRRRFDEPPSDCDEEEVSCLIYTEARICPR